MKYAAVIEYCQDQAKIAAVRPAHREYLLGLQRSGNYAIGGPFAGDTGALIVYEAETREQVEGFIRQDPFGQQGVFVSWKIRPWKIVMATPALLVP